MDRTPRDSQISTEFAALYNTLDSWMRNALEMDKRPSFSEVLRKMMGNNPTIKRYHQFLQDMGEVRNLVVHSRKSDGVGLVVPTQRVVNEFHRIVDLIMDPPSLLSKASRNLTIHDYQDSLSVALGQMKEHDFSQLITKDPTGVHRLITREGIAKWLEKSIEDDLVSIADTTIEEVLSCDDERSCRFLPHNSTVFEGLEAFTDPKRRIQAVVLTQNGRPQEKPLGLVTAFDIADIALVIA